MTLIRLSNISAGKGKGKDKKGERWRAHHEGEQGNSGTALHIINLKTPNVNYLTYRTANL
jgi:hypothetical protein